MVASNGLLPTGILAQEGTIWHKNLLCQPVS